ncbi:MAG TPA: hypothetical protein ENI34_07630 [candidate division WOR-3 bacterium]|uniref:Glycosyl hydrolase-like 10 domain-containing protein n=1 Tax=candidate division WOR-3 bacterium TaxID=2052148 RepID=A0A9C9ENC1_UNCW3|nr:hypothetical protein [candidate division WOR-3 bacterium]
MTLFLLLMIFHTDFRGIWIPRWSLADKNKIFTHLEGRFNHIFLQIFALGEAYYPSRYAPSKRQSDEWLKNFIAEAHRRNIKVSAWVNFHYSWGYAPRPMTQLHPINHHPDWYVQDIHGRSILEYSVGELKKLGLEGYYLAPANPQVQSYLSNIAEEIIENYDFDGLHIDYIRYPNDDFIYDPLLRSKFMRRYYIDPMEIMTSRDFQKRYSLWGAEDLKKKWQRFVSDDLTRFIKDLRDRLKKKKPDLLISAAVKPDYISARYDFYQDWLTWLNSGYVDFVCLMSYTRALKRYFSKIKKSVDEPRRVVFGIGLYILKPKEVSYQVKLVDAQPFAGVVFFSYEQLKKNKAYLHSLILP